MPNYTPAQIAAAMRKAGFPESAISTGVAIVMAESGGRSEATNPGTGKVKEYSVGPWQINLNAHGSKISEQLARNLDSATNYAYSLWQNSGWQPWGAFTAGCYKQFLNGGQGREPMAGGGPGEWIKNLFGGGAPNTDLFDYTLAWADWVNSGGSGAPADFVRHYVELYKDAPDAELVKQVYADYREGLEARKALQDLGPKEAILSDKEAAFGRLIDSGLIDRATADMLIAGLGGTGAGVGTSAEERKMADLIKRGVLSQDAADQLALAGLIKSAGLGGTAGRTRFPEETQLDLARIKEIEATLADRPLANALAMLREQIALGRLQRDAAQDLWTRRLSVDTARREAPLKAAQTIETMGGGFVPNEPVTLPMSGLKTSPTPFAPFVQAFLPNIPEEHMALGPDPAMMAQLAQQAAAAQKMAGGMPAGG